MTQPPRENLPQQAGMLCNDVTFRRFAAHECGLTGQEFSTEAAATFLRQQCQIASRRELALAEFHKCAMLLRALEYLAAGDFEAAEKFLSKWVPDA